MRVALGVYRSDLPETVSLSRDVILSGGWKPDFTQQAGRSIIDGPRGVSVAVGVNAELDGFEVSGHESEGIRNLGTLLMDGMRVSSSRDNGLVNLGRMTVTNSRFDGSYKNGIINEGSLMMTGALIMQNGRSGISNTGALTLTQVTIRDHNVGWGCNGINNQKGSLYLAGSAILHNGSIYPAVGAGLCNWGQAILVNSLISDNHSAGQPGGGGIYNSQGRLTLNNTTIIGNSALSGGGIFNDPEGGEVILQNSLVADNSAGQGLDCYGGVQSLGYNLIGNPNGCGFRATEGDLLNTPSQALLPIGDQRFAPLVRSSPAIDAGNPAGCSDGLGGLLARDQRGVVRLGRCDIGSYEYDPAQDPLLYQWFPFTPVEPIR